MAVPRQINDGNWNLPNIETVDLSYPFSLRGDGISFEATLKVTQDKFTYIPRRIGDQLTIPDVQGGALRGFIVDQGDPKDIGNGLFEVRTVVASIPQNRIEPSSTTWTINLGIRDNNLVTATNSFPAEVHYEYGLSKFTPTTSAKVIQDGRFFYAIKDSATGYIAGLPEKGNYLADDSEVGIYKGKIYFRRSVFVIYPGTFLYQDNT